LKKIFQVFFAFFLAATLFSPFVCALTRRVGVKAGDWAKYDFSTSWISTNPEATEPGKITEQRKLKEVRFYVKEVAGLNVTSELTLYFENGTETSETILGNIQEGSMSMFLVAADLQVGEAIAEFPAAPLINETLVREYAGAKREVNHAKVALSLPLLNQTLDFYWDKKTGLLCEFLTNGTRYVLGGYSETVTSYLKISETNVWQPESFLTQWWLLSAVVAVLIAVAGIGFFKLLKKPRAPEESEKPEPKEWTPPPPPSNTEQEDASSAKPKNE